jgi:hypothetical protein
LREQRPTVIFECYNPFLANFGNSVKEIRDTLSSIGYSVISADRPYHSLPDDFEGEALAFPAETPPAFTIKHWMGLQK